MRAGDSGARPGAFAFDRLRALITSIYRDPKPRKKTRPSKGSVQRRLESKRARSHIKQQRRGGYEF